MARKTQFVDEQYLMNVPLPQHGNRYTVVSHDQAVQNMKSTFNKFGYNVKNSTFKVAREGRVAIGTFSLNLGDSEMGYMVGFVNSYDKSKSFQYFHGSEVFVCENGLIIADNKYRRKHTGDVDTEAFLSFDVEMGDILTPFNTMKKFREELKLVPLSTKEMAELAGRMFVQEELLTPRQMSDLKMEIMKPSYDYSGNNNSGWEFYNHLTHVAKRAHPTEYFSHHESLSNFVINEFGILQNKATIEDINFEMMEDSFENHLIYS
jgi:hypothetical protein